MLDLATNHASVFVTYSSGFVRLFEKLDPPPHRTEKTKLYLFTGKSGTGKSRLAFELAGGTEGFYKRPGKWWDGYSQQRVVVLDDYRGDLDYNELLLLADRYPHRVEVKNGSAIFNSQLIIITSTKTCRHWYPDENEFSELRRRTTYHTENFCLEDVKTELAMAAIEA